MSHTDKKKQEKIELWISTDHGPSEDFIYGISVSFLSPISRPQPVMPSYYRIGFSPHQHWPLGSGPEFTQSRHNPLKWDPDKKEYFTLLCKIIHLLTGLNTPISQNFCLYFYIIKRHYNISPPQKTLAFSKDKSENICSQFKI